MTREQLAEALNLLKREFATLERERSSLAKSNRRLSNQLSRIKASRAEWRSVALRLGYRNNTKRSTATCSATN
jgi:septal ring factor EnvC (AmiA/AmiB activator)